MSEPTKPQMIENTATQGERGWTLGRNPSAIAAQEKAGQAQLCADSALPVKGLDTLPAEWGIQVRGPRANDPLFADVTLPDGWKLVKTNHDMWSELRDETGAVRAEVFYKAAYYDRDAFIEPRR